MIPATLTTTDAGLLTTSTVFGGGRNEHVLLVLCNVLFVFVVGLYASQLGRMVSTTQHKLHVQAWHLRKLLPTT